MSTRFQSHIGLISTIEPNVFEVPDWLAFNPTLVLFQLTIPLSLTLPAILLSIPLWSYFNYDDGATSSTTVPVVVYMAGDANGDGVVNILDAAIVGLNWNRRA